jgi:uncharacterized protein YndB with AHSA1/START domain
MDYEGRATTTAPPSDLWRVVIDVERWPEWTPSMRSVTRTDRGPLTVGSEARVRQPGLPAATWRVSELDAGRAFTWQTSSPGVTTVAEHVVDPSATGSELTLRLRQSGPLAGVLGALYRRRIRKFLALEAAGLARAAGGA